MNDRNKSPLTHRVTATAAACLDSLGCKPVETEVPIAPGWIADVASYWYPNRTEAKRFHLHKVALPTRLVDEAFDDLDMRLQCWCAGPLTVAVEVKVSRGDYVNDRKWCQYPPANICIVAFPRGVVEEVPNGWCGLETNAAGDKVVKWHRAVTEVHPQHPGLTLDFVAQVGIRRDHRTRYRALKDWAKAYRAKDVAKKKQLSIVRLIERLASWLQRSPLDADRTLHDIFALAGIEKVPDYLGPAIDCLEAMRLPEDRDED